MHPDISSQMRGMYRPHLQATWFHLSSPASPHLHFNPTIPTVRRHKPSTFQIYGPRASLPPHCRGEKQSRLLTVVLSALTRSWHSDWMNCVSQLHPVGGPNANFAFGLSQNLLPFSLLFFFFFSFHPRADKNSSSSNAHGVYKDRNACMHT